MNHVNKWDTRINIMNKISLCEQVTRRPFVVYKTTRLASLYKRKLQQLHNNDMSRSFKVKIIRATDLKSADLNGKSDPYVKALLVSEKAESKPVELHKTQAVKKVRQINVYALVYKHYPITKKF